MLSLEVIITFSFFLAAMLVFMATWEAISASYYREARQRDMQTSLIGISDMLVLSPGDPANWETGALGNANAFGAAASRGTLSSQKLAALQSLNSSYDKVREGMGAGASDVFISVEDTAGTALYRFGNPCPPAGSALDSASIERLAILEGEIVKLKVQVWRNKAQ